MLRTRIRNESEANLSLSLSDSKTTLMFVITRYVCRSMISASEITGKLVGWQALGNRCRRKLKPDDSCLIGRRETVGWLPPTIDCIIPSNEICRVWMDSKASAGISYGRHSSPQLLEKNRCLTCLITPIVRPIADRPTFEMRPLDEQTKTLITLNLTEMDALSIDGFVTCWLCCVWRGEKWDINGKIMGDEWSCGYGYTLSFSIVRNGFCRMRDLDLMNLGWWSGCWNNTSWF